MMNSEQSRSWVGPILGSVVLLAVAMAWVKFRPGAETSTQYDATSRLPEWSPEDESAILARTTSAPHNNPTPDDSRPTPVDPLQPRFPATGSLSHEGQLSPFPVAVPSPIAITHNREQTGSATPSRSVGSLPGGRFTEVVPVYFEESAEAMSMNDSVDHRRENGVVSAHWTTALDGRLPVIIPVSQRVHETNQSTQQTQHPAQQRHATSPAWLLGTIETLGRDR